MNKKVILGVAAIALIALLGWYFYANKGTESRKQETVKIGVILPLSGDVASYGIDSRDGILYAIEELYQDKATVIFEDSKGEPKTAVTAYNKLVNMDKVNFVIGDLFSNTTLAIAPLANQKKNLLISPTASTQDIPKNGIYSLSVYPSETFESELVAKFINSKYKTTAVLYEKVAAAQVMSDVFVQNSNIKISFVEGFASDTPDFSNILLKLKNSGAESVYLVTYTNNGIKILDKMKTLNMKTNIVGPSSLFDPSLYDYLKEAKFDFHLTGPSFDANSDEAIMRSFSDKFVAKYSKLPNQMAFQGYIAVSVANDFYTQINEGTYTEDYLRKYNKQILGKTFSFSSTLTSQLGLTLYKFENGEFRILTE